ncbi:MAG: hypothetical protein ACUVX9_11855 [Anaerolineae bacterium]
MGDAAQVASPASETLYCVNHPQRETLLRCNKCGQPICLRCGIRTPVGIRCKSCARLQRVPTYRMSWWHSALAVAVALPISAVAGWFMQFLGFFLAFFLGAAVGGLIAEIVYRVLRKRGRLLAFLVCGCIVAGALLSAAAEIVMGLQPVAALLNPAAMLATLLRMNVVYVILAVGAAYARLQ